MRPIQTGRYQLFQGKTAQFGDVEANMVLRLDTETGKTDVYFATNKGDKPAEGWLPLKNDMSR
jgi:hypothetical protein